jgi:copper homeostasis protein
MPFARNATLDARSRVRVEARVAKRFLLEISVQTVEAAQAAERGGADRVELCADLSVGGLTPPRELLRAARAAVRIPIFSMVRPRAGDFAYSPAEFDGMKHAIAVARECGMNGVVLGILHKDHRVDVERTRELVELARPLPVTFHRAFDECSRKRSGDDCPDLSQALEDVVRTGAARILTSGGAKSALAGAARLRTLVEAAGNRLIILPGAGISAENLAEVARQTAAPEFHSGLSSMLPYSSRDFARFEAEVAKLARGLS